MACERCGGTVAPDGRCWDCGHAQEAFRSRLEIVTDGGAAVSDRGLRRGVNADAVVLTSAGPWTIAVVCDGVSMSPRPERAAQVATDTATATLVNRLPTELPEDALHAAATAAGKAVAALAASPQAAPACTYVTGVVGPQGIWVSWIGDSRAYWLPDNGTGMAMTEDDTGAEDALSAWLGADAGPTTAQIRSYCPHEPGHLLLCTDGLWRYLPTASSLRAMLKGEPSKDVTALVQHALDEGGHDNVTVAVIPVSAR